MPRQKEKEINKAKEAQITVGNPQNYFQLRNVFMLNEVAGSGRFSHGEKNSIISIMGIVIDINYIQYQLY